jgi:hypothetical protein
VTTREQQLAANLRLVCAARPRTGDAVADADHQTAMADLRAAVCLANGVSPDDIGPRGHDHSKAGYARVRVSWVRHIEQFGLGMFDDNPERVLGYWREVQPELARGDDWRAEGARLHKERYPEGCRMAADDTWPCVICSPVPDEWL